MWNTFPFLSQTFTGSRNFAVGEFFWKMLRIVFWHLSVCEMTLRHFRWLSSLQMLQIVTDFRVTDFVSFFFGKHREKLVISFFAVSIEVGRTARAIWVHWQSLIGIRNTLQPAAIESHRIKNELQFDGFVHNQPLHYISLLSYHLAVLFDKIRRTFYKSTSFINAQRSTENNKQNETKKWSLANEHFLTIIDDVMDQILTCVVTPQVPSPSPSLTLRL